MSNPTDGKESEAPAQSPAEGELSPEEMDEAAGGIIIVNSTPGLSVPTIPGVIRKPPGDILL